MRREFTKAIKRDAAARAQGRCENCSSRLAYGDYHYDHVIADALGGEPTLDNCQVLCRTCHSLKTTERDVPLAAKAKRISDRAQGIKKHKRKIPQRVNPWG